MAEQRVNQLNVYIPGPSFKVPLLLPTITPIPLGPTPDGVPIAAGVSCVAQHYIRQGRMTGALFDSSQMSSRGVLAVPYGFSSW